MLLRLAVLLKDMFDEHMMFYTAFYVKMIKCSLIGYLIRLFDYFSGHRDDT